MGTMWYVLYLVCIVPGFPQEIKSSQKEMAAGLHSVTTTVAFSPRGCCTSSVLTYLCRRAISAPSDHLLKTGQLAAPEHLMSQSTQAERLSGFSSLRERHI